ncbi:hypothetical protein CesoFtcFv8_027773 [Champsocephalus esox]|uniref:Uncharacterized protein n=2 Tax=Champsocephalus TaxID=52236 RepID=A0AAN8BTY1_CHAGU|nr:hypothetical protein CesoFtcFv8_027773 [Champsocephalus esox]KAK5891491.1 hypothetical protein CgunFtcFv8_018737 [Champsocephalus gunnari]
MTASKRCCLRGLSAHSPPIEASLQGFSSHSGQRGGGEGESLAPSDRSPTGEAFVARLLTLGNVESGGL